MRVLFLTSHDLGREAWDWLWKTYRNVHSLTNAFDKPMSFPQYDLGISFLYNYRVPETELNRATWINFHPAPLPEYGGRNVAYHAIMNNAKRFGATVHYMTKDFDAGDIIDTTNFLINPDDRAGDIATQARADCLTLFERWIPRFLAGEKPIGTPQVNPNYYPKKPIDSEISLSLYQQKLVRAITAAPDHYPYTVIGGRHYKIISE